MFVIQIPEATCGTNELVRDFRHAHARARERDRWHYLVMEAFNRVTHKVPITCCEITVTRVSGNPMDWDNMGGGLKFLMDALVSNQIILDDRPNIVRQLHLEQRITRTNPPKTIIKIVPLKD